MLSCGGNDGRLMVVVGPCSIHDPNAALDYATLLAKAAEKHSEDLMIIMRVYVEKPRSTVGWKGYVHEPEYATGMGFTAKPPKADLNKGILMSRQIMLDVAKMGLPVATELLNPCLSQFFDDVVSLGVIGARTTESQTHREMSSNMSMPIGFKNGTDGGIRVAIDAMKSTAASHTILGNDEKGRITYHMSTGNKDTFLIMRGGSKGPNFSAEHMAEAEKELVKAGKEPCIVVDCSHGNSNKDYRNQAKVAACVAEQVASGAPVMGVMIESNLNEGRQDVPSNPTDEPLKYGVSITDACVGWCETELILDGLAAAVRERSAGACAGQRE